MIRAYVFTYNRPEMLKKVVDHLQANDISPIVINDGGKLPELTCEVRTHKHRGKKEYWKTWQEVITDAKQNPADIYLFIPDDFLNLDIERVHEIHKRLNKYVYNLINDGRLEQWVRFKPTQLKEEIRVGFCDGGFFCDRGALLKIGNFKQPPAQRWNNPAMSSGIGQQLTVMLHNAKVSCFVPNRSLAFHGDHESKMNPEERKRNPLISK